MRNTRRRGAVLATTTALALTLAGCGSSDESSGDTESTPGADATGAANADPITIGIHSGWEEGIAVSYLWQHILEEQGYEVEMETADAGIVFTALSEGDYDVNFDTWLPQTHADYLEEFGAGMEELGMWFEGAPLTIAVNEDAPIDSLAELAENADAFDGRLIGIESGAGLTRVVRDSVIPTYELEGMEFLISSTPAMLAELEAATNAGENVVVTLWRPHWAYDAFPIKDLEDPEGALGDADDIFVYGASGFAAEYPEVAEWIANFTMDSDELHALVNIMWNENEGNDNEGSIEQWLEENPDFVSGITG